MIQYAIWMASGSTSWVLQLFSHEPLGTSNTLRLATHRRSLAAVDRPLPNETIELINVHWLRCRKRCSFFQCFFMFSFFKYFFSASVIILPFAVRASSSCHAPVILSKFQRPLRWRWPSIVERLTGSPHSAVSRTAIAQPASANALRYVKIIDHHDTW